LALASLAQFSARLSRLTFKGYKMNDKEFLNQKWLNRFQIFATDDGFMAYDHDCDEYLDDGDNNCFDTYSDAMQLIDDAILTVLEHQGD
jgi:hypothetical protein